MKLTSFEALRFYPAIELREAGSYLEAEKCLSRHLEVQTNDAQALAHLAHIQLLRRKADVAQETLMRAEALAPDDPLILRNRARLALSAQQTNQAAASIARALAIDGANPENRLIQAAVLLTQGHLPQALTIVEGLLAEFPDYAEAWGYRALLRMRTNNGNAALADATQATTLKPHLSQAWRISAALHLQAGRRDEAIAALQRYCAFEAHDAVALADLGELLRQSGRIEEAVATLRCAIKVGPMVASTWANLGTALQQAKQIRDAEDAYKKALALDPLLAEVENNLGGLFKVEGRLSEAELHYRRALEFKPELATAHLNLARLLLAKQDTDQALTVAKHALQLEETAETKTLFVECLRVQTRLVPDSDIRALLVRAISETWGVPKILIRIATDFLKASEMSAVINSTANAWPAHLSESDLLGPCGLAAIASDGLLRCTLESAPICDVAFERFLTAIRRLLLAAATSHSSSFGPEIIAFCCAIARQCFINEYVFACAQDEFDHAQVLRELLIEALASNAMIPPLWLPTVGAYYPLGSLAEAGHLLERTWPDSITQLLVQQVKEPMEERRNRELIQCLTPITDHVSALVQRQYEENPYPRWVRLAPVSKPGTFGEYLRAQLPWIEFHDPPKPHPEILIAGCGTGQHSIETAMHILGAKVLAIDLSMASLCYAVRKTHEFGLDNIEYAQADLLQLRSIGRRFDVIEASGVLHHLDDPIVGWRTLLSLLRPGGFMRVGLYSELARRDIVAARALIEERECGLTAQAIRQARQQLIAIASSTSLEKLLSRGDFFSTSECRDLLFHVQEHRMTLQTIKAFIHESNLTFLGFTAISHLLGQFHTMFPEREALTDLDSWHVFETGNPDCFISMYQFWIQKPAKRDG